MAVRKVPVTLRLPSVIHFKPLKPTYNMKFFFSLVAALCCFAACTPQSQTPAPAEAATQGDAPTYMEIVRDRYTCRAFDSVQITQEQLDLILEAGRVAPTSMNLQEQRIYVCQSPEVLAKIDSLTPCRYGAPTCIVVAWDKNNVFTYPGGRYNSGTEDAAIVATHMMLAAQSVGVNSCWVNYFDPDLMARSLALPANEQILMILDLGYAAPNAGPNQKHFERKPIEETVRYL